MSQSILTNTIIALSGRVINVVLGIVVLSLVSRFLGVAPYGSYVLLLAYGAILQTVADLGLYLTLSRTIAAHPDQENHYFSHIASLRFALLVIVFGLGWLIALLLPSLRSLVAIYPVITLGFIAQSFSQLMMGVYQKYGTVWRATIGDLVGRLVQVTGILIVGATSATLASMAAMFTLGLVVATYIHRCLLPSHLRPRPAFARATWQSLFSTSWPLGIVLILNVIYFRIDTIILSLYRPASQVGLYGLAYRLIESGLFLPAVFGGLLLPHLSSAWHEQRLTLFSRYFEQGATVTVWAGAFIVLTLALFPAAIITLIAGPAFRAAAPLLRLLSFALGAMFVGNLIGFSLVACGRRWTLLVIAAFLATINVILNLVFIPFYGAPAAALTTVFTEFIAVLSSGLVILRLVHISLPFSYLARLVVVTLLTALVYLALPSSWPVLITITLGGATYLAASFFTRLINKQNISLLLKV